MSLWRTLLHKSGFPTGGPPSALRAVPTTETTRGQTPAQRVASLEQALREQVEEFGAEDPHSITTRNNLASKYAQIGRREAAVAQFELALSAAVAAFGEEHPQTEVIRENLAWSYEDSGRPAEAAEQWETLLQHRDQELGSNAEDTVTARSRLASCYRKSGKSDAAIAHFERAIEDAATTEGRENLRIGLSLAFSAVGRNDGTIQQLRMVFAQRHRRLGSRHHDTLVIQYRLGRAYSRAGRTAEAIDTLRDALSNGLAASGDPEIRMLTLKMRRDLAGAFSSTGRHREAAALF